MTTIATQYDVILLFESRGHQYAIRYPRGEPWRVESLAWRWWWWGILSWKESKWLRDIARAAA